MWPHIEIFPVMFIDAQHGPTMPILLGCLLSLLSTWVHIKRRDATQIYLDLISFKQIDIASEYRSVASHVHVDATSDTRSIYGYFSFWEVSECLFDLKRTRQSQYFALFAGRWAVGEQIDPVSMETAVRNIDIWRLWQRRSSKKSQRKHSIASYWLTKQRWTTNNNLSLLLTPRPGDLKLDWWMNFKSSCSLYEKARYLVKVSQFFLNKKNSFWKSCDAWM